MAIRKLKKTRYEKVMSYITPKTEWEQEVYVECKKLLSGGCQAKGREQIESWFNQLDFRLAETFGIKVVLE